MSDSSRNDNKDDNSSDINLPLYMRLYPPLENINETKLDLYKILQIKLNQKKNNKKYSLGNEKTEEENELNQKFLDDLVKPSCSIPKGKVIDIISKDILKSKLIEKIEDESKFLKKIEPVELSNLCATRFSYELIHRGEIIFKMGEIGDKFYYILKGKVNVLKMKEIPNLYMSIMEYLHYCYFLIKNNENYIFQEVIQSNSNLIQLTNEEEVLSLYKIIFKKTLYDNINQHLIYNNILLEEYFKVFEQNYSDFGIDKNKLEILEFNKKKKLPSSHKEWQNYLLKKCEITTNELITYEPFEQLIKDRKKKKVICYVYESYLILKKGSYFGDFALDSELNKRNATIRAEEDTYLGWLRGNDYISMIAPKRRYEKMKEIAFLFNGFFFQNMNPHTFERNYFHLFYLREYARGKVMFDSGKMPKNIFFIKEGQIKFELKCSVLEIHKLIKFLYNKITTNEYFSNLTTAKKNIILPKETINEIHKYIRESKLDNLKMQNIEFINEMNKVKTFHISLLIGVDAVGLEEIFMKIPYIMRGTIMKNVICYEFAVEKIHTLLKEEKRIRFNFTMNSIKKILSLMERLQGIKKNCVEMANFKFNTKSESLFEKAFSSTQYFPIIHNKKIIKNNSSNNIKNNLSENKLRITNDINYNDNIYDILNKTNPNKNKSLGNEKNKENNEVKFQEEKTNSFEEQKNEENIKKDKEQINDKLNDKNNYKKIKLMNNKDKSRNIFTSYKTPIKDFTIAKKEKYKTLLFPSGKNSKMKNIKLISYNKTKKKRHRSYFGKDLTTADQNIESTGNEERFPLKSKLDTGINTKNFFLLGHKYYTIKKLKKQIKEFNSLDNSKKTLEVIQSNDIINNNFDDEGDNPNNIKDGSKKSKIKESNNNNIKILNIKRIKKNFVKYSQDFKNFHLSFVPIYPGLDNGSSNTNTINEDNNNSIKNLYGITKYSTFGDKFYYNKTLKNYFFINKKNKIYKRKNLIRVNSDLTEYNKKLPEIQNDFINYNIKEKNNSISHKNSNINFVIDMNKNKYEYIPKVYL